MYVSLVEIQLHATHPRLPAAAQRRCVVHNMSYTIRTSLALPTSAKTAHDYIMKTNLARHILDARRITCRMGYSVRGLHMPNLPTEQLRLEKRPTISETGPPLENGSKRRRHGASFPFHVLGAAACDVARRFPISLTASLRQCPLTACHERSGKAESGA